MIVVRITLNVLPEKQQEVEQTLLSMMGPMEKVAGCLSYSLFCDIQNRHLMCLLEEWESRKKLDLHFRSDLFGVLLGIRGLLGQPQGIHIYTVQQAEGMNAVRTMRKNGTKKANERN